MAKTVLVPGWPWSLKDGVLHWGLQAMRKADAKTFEPLDEYWGRDDKRVYCAGSELRSANRSTFRVLNSLYARDSSTAYTIKGPIRDADAASFEAVGPTEHVFNTTNGYAKDSRNVYHTIVGDRSIPLKGCDPASFRPRGHGYGCDGSSVFFERKKVPGADPAVWQHLCGPHSRSGKNAYVLGQRMVNADGRSLESLPVLEPGVFWARDDAGYHLLTEAADARAYLEVFRQCFIMRGKVTGISLTWGHTNPLPAEPAESWAIADHAWIDVVGSEWLQKPDLEVARAPTLGEPFRFGEGGSQRLRLLSPPSWIGEERIWMFRPAQDQNKTITSIELWWEYLSLNQIGTIQSLISAAR